MAKLFDRVKVNIPTTGTGDIEFGAAASTAFLTPVEAGVLDGDEVRYVIVDGLDFEEGVGLIKDTVATMERTVTKSKVSGTVGTSALNLSGTAVLALTASAADILTPWAAGATGFDIFKAEDEDDVLTELPSVYHRDNVVGSVGFSGGKNTGAIIESGSNANGSYVKFADGTMICRHRQGGTGLSLSAVSNMSYASGFSWTYPAGFASAPAISVTGSNQANQFLFGSANTPNASGFTYAILGQSASSNVSLAVDLIAIGRWRT